jgi:UDP-N-acetyl-D-mannosaminuronic acid dehydrogenase
MNLVVVGMGYVGIPSAALFADVPGIMVTGVQRRSKRSGWKIDYLNQGMNPIGGEEPGLDELIRKVVEEGKFRVTDDMGVYRDADVILIDVQTPVDQEHQPQYGSLKTVSQEIGERMNGGVMVGIESTVAPGTTQHIVKPILEKASGMEAGVDFNLIFSYERVMVGRLLHNLKHMPRIVGGHTPQCAKRGAELYRKITRAEIYQTDCMTAEISKTVENAYRDVNIAFANEVALICESLGADVHEVRRYVNSLPHDPSDPDKNPYRMMMIPGAGVGGHCLPKDPWLLKYGADTHGSIKVEPRIIMESRRTNDHMPLHMKELILEALIHHGKPLGEAKITILGYAFLENSDDTRNTPARPLYESLGEAHEVIIHDPHVRDFQGANHTRDLNQALKESDCLALVTKHREYFDIKLDWLKKIMNTPIIVDGRNVFNPREAKAKGFTFKGVGIGEKTGQN